MAKESRYDSYELIPPDVGVCTARNPIDDSIEYFSTATNVHLTQSRSLRTRPGFSQKLGVVVEDAIFYKIWLCGSFYIASVYSNFSGRFKLMYRGTDVSVSPWTDLNEVRDSNNCRRAHILTMSRGVAYVRTFPYNGSSEKLGSILIDFSSGTPTAKPWGLLGPTTPAKLSGAVTKLTADVAATATTFNVTSTTGFPSPAGTLWIGLEKVTYTGTTATSFTGLTRGVGGTEAQSHRNLEAVTYYDWGASDHQITVKYGWTYSYAYKSLTGAISNRADVERNPDLMRSSTVPFFDLVPKVIVKGHADTTNIPTIQIYRTTDGGGKFFLLEEIVNTGAGDITYYDDSFGTGGSSSTFNDPVPDTKLDTATPAPTLVSNSPPPPVNPPGVIGSTLPTMDCYAMTTYAGRIFYSVGTYLYYSSREETLCGVPEEEFATDLASGGANYSIFNAEITGLASDNESLWIFTPFATFRMFGYTKDSFYITKVFDVGAQYSYTGSTVAASNGRIAFLTPSGAIYLITENGNKLERITDNIAFPSTTFTYYKYCLQFYKNAYKELLYFAYQGAPGLPSREVYVYDITLSEEKRRPVWTSIWDLPTYLHAFSAFDDKGVIVAITDLQDTVVAQQELESSTDAPVDYKADDTTRAVSVTLETMPIRVPPGNHVNTFNRPTRDVKVTRLFVYHFPVSGNYVLPTVTWWPDNYSVTTLTPSALAPPRVQVESPGSYTISVFPLRRRDVYRAKFRFTTTGGIMNLYGFAVEFMPHYTATEV